MFMVKDEFENTKKLLSVKLKTSAGSFQRFFLMALLIHLISFIRAAAYVMQNNGHYVETYHMADYSLAFFVGIVIASLVLMITYKQTNDYLSMLPQTNNSRFIATQLFNYIFAGMVGLAALVMYLLNFGILKLLMDHRENYYFALTFDIGFVVTGFFTFIVYSFIIIALFGLIGAILRKWTYYAAVASLVIVALMVINLRTVIDYAPKVLASLVNEPVPAWFIIKGIVLWFVIAAISLAINYFTVYHKSQRQTSAAGIAVIIVIIVAVFMVVPALLMYSAPNSGVLRLETQAQSVEDYLAGFTEISLDVSHLPKGSKLKFEGKNVYFSELDNDISRLSMTAYASGAEELNNLQGDTLRILYRLPTLVENGINLYEHVKPSITAYLTDDTLHIDYEIERTYVIFLPIWGIAGQFDGYADKGVLLENVLGSSYSGLGAAHIYINPK